MNRTMIILTLIIPFIYIFGGILLTFRPPVYGSGKPGYGSRRARLSADTWNYANYSFGVVCIFMGIYVVFATALTDAIVNWLSSGTDHGWIWCVVIMVVQVLCVLFPRYYTEHQLKVYFDEKGDVLYPEKIKFRNRKTEKDWDDWDKWPGDEDEDDGWDDWETWLSKRDMELDQEREQRMTADPDKDSGSGQRAAESPDKMDPVKESIPGKPDGEDEK